MVNKSHIDNSSRYGSPFVLSSPLDRSIEGGRRADLEFAVQIIARTSQTLTMSWSCRHRV